MSVVGFIGAEGDALAEHAAPYPPEGCWRIRRQSDGAIWSERFASRREAEICARQFFSGAPADIAFVGRCVGN